MLLPGTRRYYLLTVAGINTAALKQLYSLPVNIIIILTKVDGCSNLPKTTGKKGYVLSPFCARPHREMTGSSVTLCYQLSLFQIEFSWTSSGIKMSARIKMI